MNKSDEVIAPLIALVLILFVAFASVYIVRHHRHWRSEPFEPTIKITIKNGVQDTTYGYTLEEILKK